jgi:hypothetical protein
VNRSSLKVTTTSNSRRSNDYTGSEQEFPLFSCIFGISVFPGRPPPGCVGGYCRLHSWAVRWGFWTRLQYVQPCPAVECAQARRAGLRITLAPAFFMGESGALSAKRVPSGSYQANRPARKTLILLESGFLRPITEGWTSPPHGFATPGDSAMPEFLPVPTTNQPRRDQVEKMPVGVKRLGARQLGVSTNSRSDPMIHNLRRADSPVAIT